MYVFSKEWFEATFPEKEIHEQQSRKIVDMQREEFKHQRLKAQTINYENTTT